jgi:peroxiredoxin Q/BCP
MAPEFDRRNVRIVAISVDEPDDSRDLAERLGLEFPLLRDADRSVAREYGVAASGYGASSKADEIVGPAILLIAPDRTILWKEVGERYGDLPTGETILAEIDEWIASQG